MQIPDIGALLGAAISSVPARSRAGFLARLERVAGARYREWAQALPAHASGLQACAEREDTIARRAEALLPVVPEDEPQVATALAEATKLYAEVFEGHSTEEQLTLQAYAERQGSLAWQSFAGQSADELQRRELAALSALEIENAVFLDQALGISSER